jgi:hypothetical protein
MKTLTEKIMSRPVGKGIEPSSSRLRIRETVFEDYHQIVALQTRNNLRTRAYEEWRALWTGNPVYKEWRGQWPIGWVLEAENGQVVGSIGNIPVSYRFRGRELRAATSCSWVVDELYRGYSMPVMACLMRQKHIDLFVCTTVSPSSEPGYRTGFKFSRVPVGAWNKSAFWITYYRGFSEAALAKKSVLVRRAMGFPMSAALFCWDRLRDGRLRISGSTPEIELCDGFDGRFDEFWDELKRQKRDSLLAVRDRATLAWHFGHALNHRNIWILAISKGSRMVAYAIFDRPDNPAGGLKRIRLVDFQALRGHEKELGGALRWMLQKSREEGIHFLENAGCWLERLGLPSIRAPYQRRLGSWMYYYRANDENLSETLTDGRVWAPSSFDGDATL